ncbi:Uncharacterised protein [Streptococcus pyogenes]|nr:hypothetical protein CCX85_05230 [Streptococcus pyogenes]CCG26635.1 hypothetical protein [Streptococcus pyogenes NS88.2]OAC59730.1 hypothetical protein AWU03_04665 [Streptococcus pyogenes]OAC62443.1 hypothetical protein AWU05_06930 [Streptococcus pyogenes]OAC63559.1 hypothetical protein AWU06_06095 [Streptococcus pyogenes]
MVKEVKKLADDMACLVIWAIILLLLHLLTSGWIWLAVKFVMTVMLILGVRDWFVDWTLFSLKQKYYKTGE